MPEDKIEEIVADVDSNLSFSQALDLLEKGFIVKRKSWTTGHIGKIDEHEDVGCTYEAHLYMGKPKCTFAKYTPTDEDLFAKDWEVTT